MTSTYTNRGGMQLGSGAIKDPCIVTTIAAITLSGEQTIDGVAVTACDRVLVICQGGNGATPHVDNGIYYVSTTSWVRSPDFDGAYDAVSGCQVYSFAGNSQASGIWRLQTPDPIAIGTTALQFTIDTPNGGSDGSGNVTGTGASISGNFPIFNNTNSTGIAPSIYNASSFDISGAASAAIAAHVTASNPHTQYALLSSLGSMSTQSASAVAILGGSITGLSTPVNPSDAATKSYVDASGGGGGGGGSSSGFTLTITPDNTLGLVLDGVTDDTNAYQKALTGMGAGICKVISEAGMYLTGLVSLVSGQEVIHYECPVFSGPNAALSCNGQLLSLPATSKPHLFANITAGVTSFQIIVFGSNVTPAPGNQFQLRGQRDVTGQVNSNNKEYGYIATATNTGTSSGGGIIWDITTVTDIQNSYQIRYTGDAYEVANPPNEDLSEFLICVYSAFSSDVPAGSFQLPVTNVASFNIGDWVFMADNETVGNAMGTADTNFIHQETNRIVDINYSTGIVKLQNACYHPYTTAYNGGFTTMQIVYGSKIVGARAQQKGANSAAKNYAFKLECAVNCDIVDCTSGFQVVGTGGSLVTYGQYGEAFRMQNCYNSRFVNAIFHGQPTESDYPSAQGYGLVFNGSTHCKIVGGAVQNARHGVLIQDGSCGNDIGGVHIINPRISGIDTHGINARQNHFHDCVIVGGTLFSPDAVQKAAVRCGNSSHTYGDHNNTFCDIKISGFNLNAWSSGTNQGYGIDLAIASGGNLFYDIDIDGCDYGIHAVDNSTYPTVLLGAGNIIRDTIIRNAALNSVYFNGGTSLAIGGITLDNITDDGNANHFFFKQMYSLNAKRLSIRNSVATSGNYAVTANDCLLTTIEDSDFNGANRGISIQQCPGIEIIGNKFRNQVESIVLTDSSVGGGSAGFVFNDNTFDGTPTPSFGITSTGFSFNNQPSEISGIYYPAIPIDSFSTKTVTAGRLYAMGPFTAEASITATVLGINVGTAGASGTSVALGVYQDIGGFPAQLVGGVTGVVLADATGDREVTGLSIPLIKGNKYWIAALFQDVPIVVAHGSSTAIRNRLQSSTGVAANLIKITQTYSTSLPATLSCTFSSFAAENAIHAWYRF